MHSNKTHTHIAVRHTHTCTYTHRQTHAQTRTAVRHAHTTIRHTHTHTQTRTAVRHAHTRTQAVTAAGADVQKDNHTLKSQAQGGPRTGSGPGAQEGTAVSRVGHGDLEPHPPRRTTRE